MKKSSRVLIISAVVLLVILIFGSVFYIFYYFGIVQKISPSVGSLGLKLGLKQRCGGVAGISCPLGYTCEYETNELIIDNIGSCVSESESSEEINEAELIEYNESFGKVCPLKVKFLGKKDANPIGCQCPQGFEMASNIIGYEQCYGPGTECPILSSECKPKAK